MTFFFVLCYCFAVPIVKVWREPIVGRRKNTPFSLPINYYIFLMDSDSLKNIFGAAGLGGIGVAAIVYVFREIVRKQGIYPKLGRDHAYKLLNRIIVFTFIIGLAAIGTYALLNFQSSKNGSAEPKRVEAPPSVFTGRVFNHDNPGNKVGNAKVSLESNGPPTLTTTDSEGIFSVPIGDRVREIRVRIEAAGFEAFDLRIVPARTEGIQAFPLKPLSELVSELSGYVLDDKENPIAGAKVSVDDVTTVTSVVTASDGSFWLKNIPKKYGELVRIKVTKEGYQPNPCTKDVQLGVGNHTFTLRTHSQPSRLPC